MDEKDLRVCLLNDSFPPLIDGVANTVVNYAQIIHEKYGKAVVATPRYPKVDDSVFPFPVIRYQSFNTTKFARYRAGNPLSSSAVNRIAKEDINIIHSHCPIISTVLGRIVRERTGAPLIFTYHTKFDIEIESLFSSERIREKAKSFVVNSLNACDEVWTVSDGSVDNLRSLGYKGDCIVMPNGVDLPRGRVSDEEIEKISEKHHLKDGVPVFLFVGRMMWYKGLRIILDALHKLDESGIDFYMLFVGDKGDIEEIKKYSSELGLDGKCIFAGAVYDRQILRAYYSRADMFLFPSTYDTNGIVVREAAACKLGSVLIDGSCAADGIKDGETGFFIKENAVSMYHALEYLVRHKDLMAKIGENAFNQIYMSWDDSVKFAVERYRYILDLKNLGKLPHKEVRGDELLKRINEFSELIEPFSEASSKVRRKLKNSETYLAKRLPFNFRK